MTDDLPIGVFDSGVGGLTVLNAIQKILPGEELLYLGDTARVPYGTKSPESVIKYALQAARVLVDHGIKLLVVACNTASSVALDALREEFSPLPVLGVVEPGAVASCEISKSGRIAVIGTEGTVNGQAYQKAIRRIRPDAKISAKPCSLFVALAEEAWSEGELVEQIIHKYLSDLIDLPVETRPDCLVLGCTHFPVLESAIKNVVGNEMVVVDSAATTARMVKCELANHYMLRSIATSNKPHFLVTDGPERFARVAQIFFDSPVTQDNVELVDLK
ncbi:MAG: glutamate racemase [Gammaproteobacteria bacterium]|nr:MAG: glutamate racemase [Gammaproteobacteria bacterium]